MSIRDIVEDSVILLKGFSIVVGRKKTPEVSERRRLKMHTLTHTIRPDGEATVPTSRILQDKEVDCCLVSSEMIDAMTGIITGKEANRSQR